LFGRIIDGLLRNTQRYNATNKDTFAPREKSLYLHKVKVKCTRVQALSLCKGRTAHRGSRGIVLPFLGHDTRRG